MSISGGGVGCTCNAYNAFKKYYVHPFNLILSYLVDQSQQVPQGVQNILQGLSGVAGKRNFTTGSRKNIIFLMGKVLAIKKKIFFLIFLILLLFKKDEEKSSTTKMFNPN